MTLALMAQVWLLAIVLGISGLAVTFALFLNVDEQRVRRHVKWFYRCSVWLLWLYTGVTAFVVLGFAAGFGVNVFKSVLAR